MPKKTIEIFADTAYATCKEEGFASIPRLQRVFHIGYVRAANAIEALVAAGKLGPRDTNGKHKILKEGRKDAKSRKDRR